MTENLGGLGSLEGMDAQVPQISCQKVFLSWLQLHQKWPQGLSIPCSLHDDGKFGRFGQSRRYGCTSVSKRSFCLIPKMAPKARLALSSELKNLTICLVLWIFIFSFWFWISNFILQKKMKRVNAQTGQCCVFNFWIFVHNNCENANIGQKDSSTTNNVFFCQP